MWRDMFSPEPTGVALENARHKLTLYPEVSKALEAFLYQEWLNVLAKRRMQGVSESEKENLSRAADLLAELAGVLFDYDGNKPTTNVRVPRM